MHRSGLGALDINMYSLVGLMVVSLIATWVLATGPAARAPALASPGSSKRLNRVVAGLVVIAAFAGLVARVYGLNGSFWLDEFGTLWVVEGGFDQLVDRTLAFQGQPPVYYAVVWSFVQLLGEHEAVLRLPSLLASLGALGLVIWAGHVVAGRTAALASGTLFWLSDVSIHYSADARPYALGILFTSLVLLGFSKATIQGGYRWRFVFVIGAVGLILTHYVLALLLIGIGLGYLSWPSLRVHYPWSHFLSDIALQAVLVSPFVFNLASLWSRRHALEISPEVNLFIPTKLVILFVVFLIAGLLANGLPRLDSPRLPLFCSLALCSAAPIGILLILAYSGVNLVTADRYISNAVVPLSLLGGVAISGARWPVTIPAWVMWVGLNGLIVCWSFFFWGSFSGAGREDWRQGVSIIADRSRQSEDALVLLRTFVEGDLLTEGRQVPPVLTATLRSPGRDMPSWSVIPMTYNWDLPGRDEYFERTVAPAVASRESFYYLGCQSGLSAASVLYDQRFLAWLEHRFNRQFEPEVLNAGNGMVLVHFARNPAPSLDPGD